MEDEKAPALTAGQDAIAARDFVRAVELLSPLAERGDDTAQVLLGYCLMYGSVGRGQLVRPDYERAIAMFRKAAAQGNSVALFHLGQCADHGRGLPKDVKSALDFFRQSAELGNVGAMRRLGGFFASGTAMPEDDSEAVFWTRRAVECGNDEAMGMLGERYLAGRGVPKDLVMACALYSAGGHKVDNPRELSELATMQYGLTAEQKAEMEDIVAGSRRGAPWPLQSRTGTSGFNGS